MNYAERFRNGTTQDPVDLQGFREVHPRTSSGRFCVSLSDSNDSSDVSREKAEQLTQIETEQP